MPLYLPLVVRDIRFIRSEIKTLYSLPVLSVIDSLAVKQQARIMNSLKRFSFFRPLVHVYYVKEYANERFTLHTS